jgi:WD40 repeat protein
VTHAIGPATEELRRGARPPVQRVVFSKDGNRLLVGEGHGVTPAYQVWDVRPPATPGPKPVEPAAPLFSLEGSEEPWAAWSADNEHFAVLQAGWAHGLVIWSADGKTQRRVFDKKLLEAEFRRLSGVSPGWWKPTGGLHFLGKTDKVVAGVCPLESLQKLDGSATVALFDPQTGKSERLYRGPAQVAVLFTTAVSPDGKLLAVTGDPGYEVILWDIDKREEVRRLGVSSPAPRFVGWDGKDNQTIAWGFRQPAGKPRAAALDHLLNLGTLTADKKDPETGKSGSGSDWPVLRPGQWNPDGWKVFNDNIATEKVDAKTGQKTVGSRYGVILVKPDGQRIETLIGRTISSWTFYKDSKDKQDRVVIGVGTAVYLYDPKTNQVFDTIAAGDSAWLVDVAVSPDGKYLLAAWGQQFVQLYNIEGKPRLLLNVLAVDEDWVAWAPQGYYAATPGGEKLIGWQVKKDDSTPLDFYPIERFRKLFHKPDLIKRLLETGSVEGALKVTKTKEAAIEDVLPPAVRIKEVAESKAAGKAKLQITAEATAGAKGQPVESLHLLLDGRAHPAKPETIKPGAPAKAVWVIEPLPGRHELKVLARCPDVSGASEPYLLDAALADKDRPVLYRVCVGINKYDQKGLELGSASQDAEAVFGALARCCTGTDNRFREAKGKKLLDKDATRQAVLGALEDVRKGGAKPGDLLVLFFAGHGVVQEGEFYLLTREADTGKPLAGHALSGDDLRRTLGEMPCSVLLVMDACHSGAAVKALKAATDELTRSLTDDQVAVTVLSAALPSEVAQEGDKHGLFTQTLLEALQLGGGVSFDPYERQLYVTDLYSHVFRRVRHLSKGRQNPFLNMPWTVPPLALRAVPEK